MKKKHTSKILVLFLIMPALALFSQEANISLDLGIKKYVGKVSKLNSSKYFGIQSSYTNEELSDYGEYLYENLGSYPAKNFSGPEPNGNLLGISANKIKAVTSSKNKQIISNPIYKKYGTSDFVLTQKTPTKVFSNNLNFEEASYQMAEYISELFPKKPEFYEIMDESFENVDLFSNDILGTKSKIGSFYKTVAEVFKKELPEVKIGGFSSARPRFELNNFKNWEESHKLFLDIAGEEIDFISTKLYDELDKDTSTLDYCSGSNSEAILDLIDSYTYSRFNQIKPHVITEYGLKVPDWIGTQYTPQYSSYIVQSLNSFAMSFIGKPNRIEKAIPYVLGKEEAFYTNTKLNPKANPHPWAILYKQADDSYDYSDIEKFYEFWSDVEGDRTYVSCNNPDIQVNSFYSKGKWYLIFNNLAEEAHTLNLSFTEDDILKISNYTLRRLYSNEEGILELTEASTDLHIDQLDIDPHEAFMLICDVPENEIAFSTSIVEYNNYSKQVLQSIKANTPVNFKFNKVITGKGKANLRVSFGRAKSLDLKPIVKLNGEYVLTPTNWAGYDQNNKSIFFGTLTIPIPMSYLKEDNEVSVTFADDGGKVSSVVINTEIFSDDVNNANFIANNSPVFASHGGNLLNISPTIECKAPKIVNVKGKVVKKLKFYSNGETIDISSLPKGDYKLQTSNGGNYKFKK